MLLSVSMAVPFGCTEAAVELDRTPESRELVDLEAVTAFPARIDGQRMVRVCGEPLPGEEALQPNGVELTLNLMGTAFQQPTACEVDSDLSVHEGDRIDFQTVTATGAKATLTADEVQLTLACEARPHVPGDPSPCPETAQQIPGAALHYAGWTGRCDAEDMTTRLNVAVLVDDSGSISGLVDRNPPYLEEPDVDIEYPMPITKAHESDPYDARLVAAWQFVDSLTLGHDRTIAYSFGEKNNVNVACSNGATCSDGPRNGLMCLFSEDCSGGECIPDASGESNYFSTWPISGPHPSREAGCFGSHAENRKYIELGLELMKNNGGGRAPLWQAVYQAYDFFQRSPSQGGGKVNAPRAIVVLTDGPDTCTYSDDFNFRDLTWSGTGLPYCRIQCTESEYDFLKLRNLLWTGDNNGDGVQDYDKPRNQCASGENHGNACTTDTDCPDSFCHRVWPVPIHVVQFQSPAHLNPDARLQEIACRSGGTFQFLNSEQYDKSKASDYNQIAVAMARVRHTLAGSWRAGFLLPDLATQAPLGQMVALEGAVQFTSAKLPSLTALTAQSGGAGQFARMVAADGRLLMRRACKDHADCGGTGPCGKNHCNDAGICVPAVAPDNLPCGDPKDEASWVASRCCGGVCASGTCDTFCGQ
jgi:hypothetical protein